MTDVPLSSGPDAAGGASAAPDRVRSDLDRLANLPVEEHAPIYEAIHARLRETLNRAGEDDGSSPPA